MKYRKIRVWGIWYTIRVNSGAKWDADWCGPIGIYLIDFIPVTIKHYMTRRPFFFRTRKQAREYAKFLVKKKNRTWFWTKYQIRPVEMIWKEIK